MKKIVLVLVIFILLGVGGYFYMSSKGTLQKAPIGAGSNNSSSNVFTSIKDALSKSLSLKCTYKDEKGIQTTTYIKGGAIRVMMEEVKEKEQSNNVILKDKKMYMWNEITKTGIIFTMTEPKISPVKVAGKIPEAPTNKDASLLAEIEKYKDSCRAEIIEDSFFTPPADVKFQDMSAFTESLMKRVPTANPVQDGSTVESQKALEELMKQITPEAKDGQ
jgi:flagellar basal body-associated protein FliL